MTKFYQEPALAKKVLIANDNPDIIKVIQAKLKNEYEIIVAVNGQEVLDLAKKNIPNVIVMDYHMPVMNGEEASKRLKADPELQNIPILLLTASLNISRIQVMGVDDYIDILQLMNKIKKWTTDKPDHKSKAS